MFPVLFTISTFNVYAFGFFLSIAFVLSTFLVWKLAKEELKEEEYLDAFLYTSLVSLITARTAYILFNFDEFKFNILRYIVVRETPGLSLVGGFLGAVVFLWWFVKYKKLDFLHLLDIFSVALSFALFLAKIGEQLGGAGFGKASEFFLKVRIVGQKGFYHPVEFYESLVYLVLFLVLLVIYNNTQRTQMQKAKYPTGLVFLMFSQVSLLSVFLLEFLKKYSVYLYGLSFRQIVVFGLILINTFFIYKKIRQMKSFKANRKI